MFESSQPLRPPRVEWAWLFVLLAGFFAGNLASYNLYPTVWCDEVWFSEPAVNLANYGSFTSMIWQLQPRHSFPVVNCPLYLMALAPWVKVLGSSLLAVRAFNYLLMAVAAFLSWRVMWCFGLVRSSWLRLIAVALLHLGYGMSYSYRCSRPDILGMILLLSLLLALRIERPRLRQAAIVLLSAATIWDGLQVALFACFAAAVWVLVWRKAWQYLLLIVAGTAVGAGSLVAFLAAKHVLPYFLVHAIGFLGKRYAHAPHLSAQDAVLRVLRSSLSNYVEDFSLIPITAGLLVLLFSYWAQISQRTRRLAVCCIGLTLAVPLLFNLVGHYAFYYSYMRFVPGALALFAVCSDLLAATPRPGALPGLIFAGTVAASASVGLPMRLCLAPLMYNVIPRAEMQRIVQSLVKPTDVVFTEQATYFEAKAITPQVYDVFSSPSFHVLPMAGGRELTAEEKNAVSVIIVRPENSQQVTNFFGGSWAAVSAPFGDTAKYQRLARVPVIGSRLIRYAEQPQNIRRQLQVFRRAEPPSGAASSAAPNS